MSNFTPSAGIGTIYTKREEIVYNIFESEMDQLSSYNDISTFCFAFGAMFIDSLMHSINTKLPILENYKLYLVYIIPWIIGIFFWFKKHGLTSSIKKKSVVIKIDEIK